MVFSLTSLPPEVVEIILRYLGRGDILCLNKCMPLVIGHEVYDHVFHDGTQFSHYDDKMFNQRANAGLFVSGYTPDIVSEKDVEFAYDNYEFLDDGTVRMYTPVEADFDEGTICQVGLGEQAIFAVGFRGEMYRCETTAHSEFPMSIADTRLEEAHDDYKRGRGKNEEMAYDDDRFTARDEYEWKQDHQDQMRYELEVNGYDPDERPNSDEAPSSIMDLYFDSDPEYEEWLYEEVGPFRPASGQFAEISKYVFNEPYKRPRFVEMSSGSQLFAFDEKGLFWRWEYLDEGGTPFCLQEKGTHKLILERIVKFASSEHYFTCLVEGRGLFMKKLRKTDSQAPSTWKSNGMRSGYPCFDDCFCYIDMEYVQGTNKLKDYATVKDCVAFLRPDGQLRAIALERSQEGFCKRLEKVNENGPFTRIVGSPSRLGLIAANGDIALAGDSVSVIHDLCNVKIASLALGKHHYLALTDDGEVYSWGRERDFNGCLALGKLDPALEKTGVWDDGIWLVANSPVKLDLSGRVFGVFAGDNVSAFIME